MNKKKKKISHRPTTLIWLLFPSYGLHTDWYTYKHTHSTGVISSLRPAINMTPRSCGNGGLFPPWVWFSSFSLHKFPASSTPLWTDHKHPPCFDRIFLIITATRDLRFHCPGVGHSGRSRGFVRTGCRPLFLIRNYLLTERNQARNMFCFQPCLSLSVSAC